MGTWTLVWMTGTALAPIFGGLALDHLGRVAYLLILAVCLLGALLFAVLRSAQSDLSAVAKAG
jgi:predicted MFS family arabinose efflux permease